MTSTSTTSSESWRRGTRQRVAVTRALGEAPSFVSAQELHALMRENGSTVGLATVYRTLQQLAEDGQIDVLRAEDGSTVYRRCSTGHHHHLVCRACRRTVEIDSAAVESWARSVADQHGFVAVDHVVELSGLCAECARLEPR